MMTVTMITTKEGKLIKIKVPTKHENEILEYYGRDWNKIKSIKRENGISQIEILKFSKFMIKRFEELMRIA